MLDSDRSSLVASEEIALGPGIFISPMMPKQTSSFVSSTSQLPTHAALLMMEDLAHFSIRIEHPDGGEVLATRAWNALWLFSLLSLAFRSPIIPLYSYATGAGFSITNRNLQVQRLPKTNEVAPDAIKWVTASLDRFNTLLGNSQFNAAQRYYNNAHYLFDDDARIMLLWAGIEGLLGAEAEISRRIALHAAILLDGTAEEKIAHFSAVKRAYVARSKVIHGAGMSQSALSSAYEFASALLVNTLRKLVDLGRVPTVAELDRLAASASIQ